jgi:hypothetical protein
MKRIWRPVTYFLAVVYFLVDLIFVGLARPISEWVGRHLLSRRLRDWIKSLPLYPSLALFSVPVILLEPIKPIAASCSNIAWTRDSEKPSVQADRRCRCETQANPAGHAQEINTQISGSASGLLRPNEHC